MADFDKQARACHFYIACICEVLSFADQVKVNLYSPVDIHFLRGVDNFVIGDFD